MIHVEIEQLKVNAEANGTPVRQVLLGRNQWRELQQSGISRTYRGDKPFEPQPGDIQYHQVCADDYLAVVTHN